MKSAGNRPVLRLTACTTARVSTPWSWVVGIQHDALAAQRQDAALNQWLQRCGAH
ncbi:hypothetical protein [Rhodoferax sp.]|uniref:hypothetical protein n=1 Tax=Rhodoferax sp. TaxID=50421 RepID=UPI0025E2CEF8|nr:hypothetical protein [Rhodoferax sp.]